MNEQPDTSPESGSDGRSQRVCALMLLLLIITTTALFVFLALLPPAAYNVVLVPRGDGRCGAFGAEGKQLRRLPGGAGYRGRGVVYSEERSAEGSGRVQSLRAGAVSHGRQSGRSNLAAPISPLLEEV